MRDGIRLDLSALADAIGDTAALLVRVHPLVAGDIGAMRPGIVNVSTWSDVRELYLAADVLITDYSSSMFDFALTDKPLVFYVDDLEEYRLRTRGVYFDLFTDPPGPVIQSFGELVETLSDPHALQTDWQANRRRFRARFCPHDDGLASARVVDSFFTQ
jgi:CDP-glycerol glycerophosphotransferase